MKLRFLPASKSRWDDFEKLFGERGACGGCWCMSWRLQRSIWNTGKGSGNKRKMRKLIFSGVTPGIIAYDGKKPIGWCSVAPREEFVFLGKSKVLAPLDDKPVWSISCMFILKEYRRKGVSVELLKAVGEFVRKKGGKIVEGYPVIPYSDSIPAAFAWTGTLQSYKRAGFRLAGQHSKARPIMRIII